MWNPTWYSYFIALFSELYCYFVKLVLCGLNSYYKDFIGNIKSYVLMVPDICIMNHGIKCQLVFIIIFNIMINADEKKHKNDIIAFGNL